MSELTDQHKIDSLPFRVDPHMLEDLGLNLYSSLPRVLVEFIANAYDADGSSVDVHIGFDLIEKERLEMRTAWRAELESAEGDQSELEPLEDRLLPSTTTISIRDNGHGMTVDELRDKFLVAGRRRRIDEHTNVTPGGRALMGRKGLGKLAGFGVARTIEVLTKTPVDQCAHGIRLDFEEIMQLADTRAVKVPTFRLSDDAGLGDSGTRVTLSNLVHESVKSREQTVRRSIGDHFVLIEQEDFSISLNGTPAKPTPRKHVYAWPEPELPIADLVTHSISSTETGQPVEFDFRFRFVEDRAALLASQRGVRVYAHKRLAAAPSLLHADTNMHGFRMTDYLDGVVHADFLDNLDRDYIATDRQGLRWETPLLQPVHDFLGDQIKEACKQYQYVRDEKKRKEVEEDVFTVKLIDAAQLSRREHKLALAICAKLASFHGQGVATSQYQEHARLLVRAVGKGEIFTAISKIAERDHPNLQDLVSEIARLTHAEIDQTLASVRSRIVAIQALQRMVEDTDFRKANNEDELHNLLKGSPWLINPTYFEFLTSNRANKTFFHLLEKELQIGEHPPGGYDKNVPAEQDPQQENRRPDLVFLLGSESLHRVVIVELKAPNTPLLHKHLLQLTDYMRAAEEFLKLKNNQSVTVEGCLIGTLNLTLHHNEIKRLRSALDDRGPTSKWQVFDLAELFQLTCNAHKEFLEIHQDELAD